jgi:uncharacterized protein YcaQ
MSEDCLSLVEARRLLLAAQGLVGERPEPTTKADVLAAIRRMGALQIDTISVVNRSAYFILWSRIGAFELAWLDELLAEGTIFEAWTRAACLLPVEDFGLIRRRQLLDEQWHRAGIVNLLAAKADLAASILARIRADGPLRAADFEGAKRGSSPWWDWRDEKLVLEMLLTNGDLMVSSRRNFQRVYDLRERVIPTWDDDEAPSKNEAERTLVLKAVKALGVATAAWAQDYYGLSGAVTRSRLEELAEEGQLVRFRVEGINDIAYIDPDHERLIDQPGNASLTPRTALLSPFDPVVADRRRARQLFGFDYLIECYTPAPKRVFGYFSLPILWRERLVGRLDAKAHRKEGIFEVKGLHLEAGVEPDEALASDLASTLRECATWHKTPSVKVNRSDPTVLAAELNRLLGA